MISWKYHIEHWLILPYTVTRCVTISLDGIPVGIKSSAVGLKICAITARTKV